MAPWDLLAGSRQAYAVDPLGLCRNRCDLFRRLASILRIRVPALKKCAVEAHAVAMLESEFASNVQLQSFDVTFWPRLHVTVRGFAHRQRYSPAAD